MQCAVCSVQCAVCNVQCAVCSVVQCAACNVSCVEQCTWAGISQTLDRLRRTDQWSLKSGHVTPHGLSAVDTPDRYIPVASYFSP